MIWLKALQHTGSGRIGTVVDGRLVRECAHTCGKTKGQKHRPPQNRTNSVSDQRLERIPNSSGRHLPDHPLELPGLLLRAFARSGKSRIVLSTIRLCSGQFL